MWYFILNEQELDTDVVSAPLVGCYEWSHFEQLLEVQKFRFSLQAKRHFMLLCISPEESITVEIEGECLLKLPEKYPRVCFIVEK